METQHGKGTFVSRWAPWAYEPARHLTKQGDQPRATWRTEAERQGREVVMEILGVHPDGDLAPEVVREALPGLRIVRSKREWVDGRPIALYETYVPEEMADRAFTALEPIPDGMHDHLEDSIGIRLVGFVETVAVRMPAPEERAALQLRDGVPVFRVTSVARSPEGPVLVDVKTIAGDAVEMRYAFWAHAEDA